MAKEQVYAAELVLDCQTCPLFCQIHFRAPKNIAFGDIAEEEIHFFLCTTNFIHENVTRNTPNKALHMRVIQSLHTITSFFER